MKKLVLSLCIITSVLLNISCSSDDSDSGGNNFDPVGTIEVTIDGTLIVFNVITFEANTGIDDNFINATATINNATDKVLNFSFQRFDEGSNVLNSFAYRLNGEPFIADNNFVSIAVNNDGSNITINFSGDLDGDSSTLEAQSGVIDIDY